MHTRHLLASLVVFTACTNATSPASTETGTSSGSDVTDTTSTTTGGPAGEVTDASGSTASGADLETSDPTSSSGDELPTGTRVTAVIEDLVAYDAVQGWCSVRYVPTLQRFSTIFVNHYTPGGYQNNSLRAFDPITREIELVHPKDVPGAPIDRDNHQMLYNPSTDEIWILDVGGNVLDVQTAWENRATAPSYGAVGWSGDLDNVALAERASIAGWPADFRKFNAVVDWSAELDTGVVFGGVAYTGQGVANDLYIVRPHPDPATARYQVVYGGNFDDELAPAGWAEGYIYNTTYNGRHNGRIIGDALYTLSIENTTSLTDNGDGTYTIQVDLLRFPIDVDEAPVEMERMAPLRYTIARAEPPLSDEGMYFPCVTYDSRENVMLVYLAMDPPSNLWAYLPDLDEWVEVETDEGAATYRALAGCDYSPDHGMHVYLDGLHARGEGQDGWSTVIIERE